MCGFRIINLKTGGRQWWGVPLVSFADGAFGACSDPWAEEKGAKHLPQRLLRELCPSLMLETSSLIKKPEDPEWNWEESLGSVGNTSGAVALKWVYNQWHKNRHLFWNLAKQRHRTVGWGNRLLIGVLHVDLPSQTCLEAGDPLGLASCPGKWRLWIDCGWKKPTKTAQVWSSMSSSWAQPYSGKLWEGRRQLYRSCLCVFLWIQLPFPGW